MILIQFAKPKKQKKRKEVYLTLIFGLCFSLLWHQCQPVGKPNKLQFANTLPPPQDCKSFKPL